MERLCIEDAFKLLCEMESNGVRPNAATYGTFLYGLYCSRQVTYAWDFLQTLSQSGGPCSIYCFNTVIHGFCSEDQVYKAIEVFHGMRKYGYSILVDGLCKQGDLLTGYDILEEMLRNGINPSPVSYSSLLQGLCKTGMVQLALGIFKNFEEHAFQHDHINFSIILHGCCQHLDLKTVYDLWFDMIHRDLAPDVYNYTSLIYALCRHRYLQEALRMFEQMFENGLSHNIVTCTILLDSFSKEGLVDEAFLFLDRIQVFRNCPKPLHVQSIINGPCKIKQI